MSTCAVTESLRHNENLFDLPLERQTANYQSCPHAADYFRQFEQHIELVRCQDDVLATIEVADYLQACGSVVVQTAGEHEKIHAEIEI